MKTETVYVCEICGKQWGKPELAASCEKKHKVPASVHAIWNPATDTDGYPQKVMIRFIGSGKEHVYKQFANVDPDY